MDAGYFGSRYSLQVHHDQYLYSYFYEITNFVNKE